MNDNPIEKARQAFEAIVSALPVGRISSLRAITLDWKSYIVEDDSDTGETSYAVCPIFKVEFFE